MGTANGPEQRQLRPEPAGRTQPCQHSNVGVEIRNVQGRGKGRKITPNLAPAPVPFLPGVSRVVPSRLIWYQKRFVFTSSRKKESDRSHSKYHCTNPKKLMIKGKLALPPKTLLQTQCPGALCPHAGARPHLQPSGAQRPSYRFHQQRKGEMLAKGGRGRGVQMGLQNLQDTSHP